MMIWAASQNTLESDWFRVTYEKDHREEQSGGHKDREQEQPTCWMVEQGTAVP